MKVVSYSRWSLNAGSMRIILEGLLYQNSGLLIQVVSNTGLTVFYSHIHWHPEALMWHGYFNPFLDNPFLAFQIRKGMKERNANWDECE